MLLKIILVFKPVNTTVLKLRTKIITYTGKAQHAKTHS